MEPGFHELFQPQCSLSYAALSLLLLLLREPFGHLLRMSPSMLWRGGLRDLPLACAVLQRCEVP